MAPTDVRSLTIETSDGAIPLVRAAGELDLSSAARLAAAIQDTAARAPARPRLVIDLVELEFCDSTGLRALIGAVKEVEVLGGRAVVAAEPEGALDHLLRLSGLREFLRVCPSADEARRRLSAG